MSWIDKRALAIYTMVVVAILTLGAAAILKAWSMYKIFDMSVIFCVVFCFVLTFSHFLPLRIRGDKIFLASDHFPSIGRKAVPINKIKKIMLAQPKRWDEKSSYGLSRGTVTFIRIEDVDGKKYRNIFFKDSAVEFKQIIKRLFADGIISSELIEKLPPLLKPL